MLVLFSSRSQASYITIPDLGTFVGQLLTSVPPSQLITLGEVSVEGSTASAAEAAAFYEQSHPGKKVELTTVPVEQARSELEGKQGMEYFLGWCKLMWAEGKADVTRGGTRETGNHLVPGWKPTTVQEFVSKL